MWDRKVMNINVLPSVIQGAWTSKKPNQFEEPVMSIWFWFQFWVGEIWKDSGICLQLKNYRSECNYSNLSTNLHVNSPITGSTETIIHGKCLKISKVKWQTNKPLHSQRKQILTIYVLHATKTVLPIILFKAYVDLASWWQNPG